MSPRGSRAQQRLTKAVATLAMTAALVIGSIAGGATVANAADTGTISNLSVSPETLEQGGTGTLSFAFSFPPSAPVGDTVSIAIPSGYNVTIPSNPTTITATSGGTTYDVATVAIENGSIVITSLVAGANGSVRATFVVPSSTPPGDDTVIVWVPSNGNPTSTTVDIIPPRPSGETSHRYGAAKRPGGSALVDGRLRITWAVQSENGPFSSTTVQDVLGEGLEIDCSNLGLVATVRGWHYSEPNGGDRWVETLSASQISVDACSPDSGFTATFTADVPAADNQWEYYVSFEYYSYATEAAANDGQLHFDNSVSFVNDGQPGQTTAGSIQFDANGSGFGLVTVSKVVDGTYASTAPSSFDLTLSCTAPGGAAPSGFPLAISLAGGESSNHYVPVNSECAVAESLASQEGTSAATASAPITVAPGAADANTLVFTNTYNTPPPVVVTPVAPTFTASQACGVDGTYTPAQTEGIAYERSQDGTVVTYTAVAQAGYVLAEGATTTWSQDIAATACIVVTPVAATYTAGASCGLPGTFVAAQTEGIDYARTVDGTTVTVTAAALEGFVLAEGATTTWTHDTAPSACPAAAPALPSTGAPADALLWMSGAAALLLLAGVALALRARRSTSD